MPYIINLQLFAPYFKHLLGTLRHVGYAIENDQRTGRDFNERYELTWVMPFRSTPLRIAIACSLLIIITDIV